MLGYEVNDAKLKEDYANINQKAEQELNEKLATVEAEAEEIFQKKAPEYKQAIKDELTAQKTKEVNSKYDALKSILSNYVTEVEVPDQE